MNDYVIFLDSKLVYLQMKNIITTYETKNNFRSVATYAHNNRHCSKNRVYPPADFERRGI
jgi:hypothetical protein